MATVVALGLWRWPRADTTGTDAAIVFVANSGFRLDSLLDAPGERRMRAGIVRLQARPGAVLYTSRSFMWFREGVGGTSDYGQRHLVDSAGVGDRLTILPDTARSTRQEAEALRRETTAREITLVTTALHTRRACATFRQVGFTVHCRSAGYEPPWWKLPYRLAYEVAATVKYRRNGWL